MNIKLEHYRIFHEAAKYRSFSRAAKELYISQSAVSQAINTLENELDAQLFIRHSKGVSLTSEGIMMYQYIHQALSLISSAENELTGYKELKGGKLIIGTGDALCAHYLMKLIVSYRQLYPSVRLQVVNGTSLETARMLKNGAIDLAFVNMPLHDDNLTIIPCQEIHDIFISNIKDDHAYSYQEIADKNLILLEKLSNSRLYLDHVFLKNNVALHPAMELGAHELLVSFAKNGLGISCVIKEFVADILGKEIYELALTPAIPARAIGYAYLSSTRLSAAAKAFIKLVKTA